MLEKADQQAKQQLANGKLGQDQYDALQREIIKTENQLKSYEGKLSSSKSEQEKLGQATSAMAKIFEASGTSVDKYADLLGTDVVEAYKKGAGSSQQMEEALKKLGDDLLGTGGNVDRLNEDLARLGNGVSFDQLQNEARESQRSFENMGKGAKDADQTIEGLNNTSFQISGIDAAVDLFGKLKDTIGEVAGKIQEAWGEVDNAQDTIIAKTGATGEAFEGMNKVFDDVYTSMPVQAQAVGDAIGELNTQFGLQGDELDSATRQLLMYSELNGTDVTISTQAAKGAMEQFGLSVKDFGMVLDVANKAGQDTGVNVDELLKKVAEGAPALQALGLSFEDSVGMMSRFEQSGINSTKVISYLTKAQAKAAKEGVSLKDALASFSKEASSSEEDTKALSAAADLFGTKGGAAMLKVAQDGKLVFKGLGASAEEAAGSVKNTFDNTQDPANNFLTIQNNVKSVLADISSTIQSALAPALSAVAKKAKAFADWFKKLDPNIKVAIAAIAGIVTAFLGLVAAIATVKTALGFVAPLIANSTGIFTGIASGLGGLVSFVAANPVVLIIAAIVAAVALLIANWDKVKAAAGSVKDFVVEKWNSLKESIGGAINSAKETVTNGWEAIKTKTSEAWEGIKSKITGSWDAIKSAVTTAANAVKEAVSGGWEAIKTKTSEAWEGIKSKITGAWDNIKTGVTNAINAVKTTVTNVWDGIKSKTSEIWEEIKTKISDTVGGIKTKVSDAFGNLKSSVQTIWDGIKSAIMMPINAAKEGVHNAIEKIKGFFNFHWELPQIKLPHFNISGKFSLNPPSIPKITVDWYKKGGIFDKPSLIGVGESGSEAVVPTDKLDKFFKDALNRSTKSQGVRPEGVVVNIDQVVVRNDSDIKKIADELYRAIRRERRVRHV